MNPEALEYIDSLKEVKGVDTDNYEENLGFYTSLEEKIPKSTALKRQILIASQGKEFLKYFDSYIQPYFIKGVPAIFTEVEELYVDGKKVE